MFQIAGYGTFPAQSLTDEYSRVTSEGTGLHLQSFQHGMWPTVPEIVTLGKIHCNMCVKTFTNGTILRRHKKEQHEPEREIFTCPVQGCRTKRARKNEMKRHFIIKHSIHDAAKLTELLNDVKSYFVPRNTEIAWDTSLI